MAATIEHYNLSRRSQFELTTAYNTIFVRDTKWLLFLMLLGCVLVAGAGAVGPIDFITGYRKVVAVTAQCVGKH